MKIFVACNGNEVAERLGKCEQFSVYEIEDRKIISKEVVANPGKNASEVCSFIIENECDILCVGGLGESGLRMLSTHGVAIGVDAKGDCDTLINNLLVDDDFDFEAFASHGRCHDHCCCGGHHETECCEGDDDECCCGEHHHEEHECCGGHKENHTCCRHHE